MQQSPQLCRINFDINDHYTSELPKYYRLTTGDTPIGANKQSHRRQVALSLNDCNDPKTIILTLSCGAISNKISPINGYQALSLSNSSVFSLCRPLDLLKLVLEKCRQLNLMHELV